MLIQGERGAGFRKGETSDNGATPADGTAGLVELWGCVG